MMIAAQAYLDGGGSDDREAIQHALGGPRLPLHRLRQDRRRGRGRGARGDSFDLTTTAAGPDMTNLGGAS